MTYKVQQANLRSMQLSIVKQQQCINNAEYNFLVTWYWFNIIFKLFFEIFNLICFNGKIQDVLSGEKKNITFSLNCLF